MGIFDRITGRAKRAAGDLADNEALRRQGVEQERKADLQEEAVREEMRAEQERASADAAAAPYEDRAARAEARAQERAAEVQHLDDRTDAGAIAEGSTREELYEEAQARDVPGRSDMTKDELAEELKKER
jgi:uncharacterized protein YjbJ (UPF0337 family)